MKQKVDRSKVRGAVGDIRTQKAPKAKIMQGGNPLPTKKKKA